MHVKRNEETISIAIFPKEELERYSNLFLPGLSSPPLFHSSSVFAFEIPFPSLELRNQIRGKAPRDFHFSILSCLDY